MCVCGGGGGGGGGGYFYAPQVEIGLGNNDAESKKMLLIKKRVIPTYAGDKRIENVIL